jgi:mRNA interferase HigB
MRIISRRALLEFWQQYPAAQKPLSEWYEKAQKAQWSKFSDVKATFGQTDLATVASGNTVAVFDIGGNKFRLIAAIHYNTAKVFVLRVLTHPQYDTNKWKEQL